MKYNYFSLLCGLSILCCQQALISQAGMPGAGMPADMFDAELNPDELRYMAKALFPDLSDEEMEAVINETLELDKQIKALPPEQKAEELAKLAEIAEATFAEIEKEYEKEVTKKQEPAKPKQAPTQKTALPEAKSASERSALKNKLISIDTTVASLFLKLGSLLRVSQDAEVESKWDGYRQDIEDFIVMLKIIIDNDKLLDVMLTDEFKLLKSELLGLEQSLAPLVKAIETSDTLSAKQEIQKQIKESSKKAVASTIDLIGKRIIEPRVSWSLKALITKYAPEEAKKIPARKDQPAKQRQDMRYPTGQGYQPGAYRRDSGYRPYADRQTGGGAGRSGGKRPLSADMNFGGNAGGEKRQNQPAPGSATSAAAAKGKDGSQEAGKLPSRQSNAGAQSKSESGSDKKPKRPSLKSFAEIALEDAKKAYELFSAPKLAKLLTSPQLSEIQIAELVEITKNTETALKAAQKSFKDFTDRFTEEYQSTKDKDALDKVTKAGHDVIAKLVNESAKSRAAITNIDQFLSKLGNDQQALVLVRSNAKLKEQLSSEIRPLLEALKRQNDEFSAFTQGVNQQAQKAIVDHTRARVDENVNAIHGIVVSFGLSKPAEKTKIQLISGKYTELINKLSSGGQLDVEDQNKPFTTIFKALAETTRVKSEIDDLTRD
jgi:hypothetical protein